MAQGRDRAGCFRCLFGGVFLAVENEWAEGCALRRPDALEDGGVASRRDLAGRHKRAGAVAKVDAEREAGCAVRAAEDFAKEPLHDPPKKTATAPAAFAL